MLLRRSSFGGPYAAGFLSWLVLSLGGRRRIAASAATAAGSSIRSGSPLAIRERRASSAPASRMVSRSGMPRCVLVPSVRPGVRVRALRADARARGGTGRPSGRSLTATDPQGCARASAPR
jgi:hypothetical protein